MTEHFTPRSLSACRTLVAFCVLLSLKLAGAANAQIEEQTYEDYVERGNYVEAKSYLIQNANVFEELDKKFLDLASRLQRQSKWGDAADLYLEALSFEPRNLERAEYLSGISDGLLSCCVGGELPMTCREWWRRFSEQAEQSQKDRLHSLLQRRLQGFLDDPIVAVYDRDWYDLSNEIGSPLARSVYNKIVAVKNFRDNLGLLHTDPETLKRYLAPLEPKGQDLPGYRTYSSYQSTINFMIDYMKLTRAKTVTIASIDALLSRPAAMDDEFEQERSTLQGMRDSRICQESNQMDLRDILALTKERDWPRLGRKIADLEDDTRCRAHLLQSERDLVDYLNKWLNARDRTTDQLTRIASYFALARAFGDVPPAGADPISDGYLPDARNLGNVLEKKSKCEELRKLSAVVRDNFRSRPPRYDRGEVGKNWNILVWSLGEKTLACARKSCDDALFNLEHEQLANLYVSKLAKKALADLSDTYRDECYGRAPVPTPSPIVAGGSPHGTGTLDNQTGESARLTPEQQEDPDNFLPYDCRRLETENLNRTLLRDTQDVFELLKRGRLSHQEVKKITTMSTTLHQQFPQCRAELWRRFGKLRLEEGRWGDAGENFYKSVQRITQDVNYFCGRIKDDVCKIRQSGERTAANAAISRCGIDCETINMVDSERAGGDAPSRVAAGRSETRTSTADTPWLTAFFYSFEYGANLAMARSAGLDEEIIRSVENLDERVVGEVNEFVEAAYSIENVSKRADQTKIFSLIEKLIPKERSENRENLGYFVIAGMLFTKGKDASDHFRRIDQSSLSEIDRKTVTEACKRWRIAGDLCEER